MLDNLIGRIGRLFSGKPKPVVEEQPKTEQPKPDVVESKKLPEWKTAESKATNNSANLHSTLTEELVAPEKPAAKKNPIDAPMLLLPPPPAPVSPAATAEQVAKIQDALHKVMNAKPECGFQSLDLVQTAAGETLENPATVKQLQPLLGQVIDRVSKELDLWVGDTRKLIDLATSSRSPREFHWTRTIAARPGADWGGYGAIEVNRERTRANKRLSGAMHNLKVLAKQVAAVEYLAKVPQAKTLGEKLNAGVVQQMNADIGAANKSIRGSVRAIQAGQLAGMMQVEAVGGTPGLTADDIGSMY